MQINSTFQHIYAIHLLWAHGYYVLDNYGYVIIYYGYVIIYYGYVIINYGYVIINYGVHVSPKEYKTKRIFLGYIYRLFISNNFKSIYGDFHIFNCRQLFRISGPHQYSALNKDKID